MDTIGKLVLHDDGIETVHKNYIIALKKTEDSKKSANSSYYIPSIRSLVMRHQKFCDYCDNDAKKKPEITYGIQLCLNAGVQICEKCLEQNKQHISFIHSTILHNHLSWWQFKSLNHDNPFISAISYEKVFKNLVSDDDKEYQISLCAPIFIERKNKTLTFPMYIKNKEQKYFDVTHIQEVSLDTFCMFHSSLDKKIIINRVKKYLTVE